MCGRYVLRLRPSEVRRHLVELDMPVEEAPDDDDEKIRQSYNFAPGYHGLIYRARTSDRGAVEADGEDQGDGQPSPKKIKLSESSSPKGADGRTSTETKFKLQGAKWGLVPFWTKRPPDYGSQMRTINCRDDSLIENRGMWNTMKQRKRCIVIAEGFFEWKKENNGKTKIPHFIKRKDGNVMCFAGLWDMVQYEGSDEKLYTYTIITTDSNKQLKFLHDRMPVIFEPASAEMRLWLDPSNVGWSKELQAMLRPFDKELDCYPVDQAVGKVGNNSPSFVIPINSKENKKNIANFFGTQQKTAGKVAAKNEAARRAEERTDTKAEIETHEKDERETTSTTEGTEDNAPLPKPPDESEDKFSEDTSVGADAADKIVKRENEKADNQKLFQVAEAPVKREPTASPAKQASPSKKGPVSTRKTRSATSNENVVKTPTKEGNKRITNFFSGQ